MWNEEEDNDEHWLDIPYIDEDEREDYLALLDGGPGEHDAYLTKDDSPFRTVPCSNCGKAVWEEATACRRCGHQFADQAYNDALGATARARWRRKVVVIALLILAILLACAVGASFF